jgi:formylglycine-generating enzyme required for sulfatase activity
MKIAIILGAALLALLSPAAADTFGSGPHAFTIDFASVTDAGNTAGVQGYGAVDYEFRLSTHEVTEDILQRAVQAGLTGVTAGAWTGDQPAAFVDWFEAAAFVNFLNTDRGFTPAYDLAWEDGNWTMNLWSPAEAWQLGGQNLYRHKDAWYFLPSENEWFKAAYYQGGGTNAGYWIYPTQQDTAPAAVASGTLAGTAVYAEQDAPAPVFVSGGLSAYGHRGLGGNVAEWMESAWDGLNDASDEERAVRGGDWFGSFEELAAPSRDFNAPLYESDFIGFRVASVPEPSTVALLALAGAAAGLWTLRRRRQRKVLSPRANTRWRPVRARRMLSA